MIICAAGASMGDARGSVRSGSQPAGRSVGAVRAVRGLYTPLLAECMAETKKEPGGGRREKTAKISIGARMCTDVLVYTGI